ncbi:polysaccharide deacetylase family protein [Paenibacillus filicis]|uniref:Polysaccharide deacetylase family protein n=1 Tax=Paenibacillus gyeongsangnamensis TaxID=3388067 RepID=A0ABT4QH37_9BACL|nr:polysaccharide deacetylase family protein [Paenibacillus filicis]MCZ8516188.1 polysaccharide deacetylase family protein [Paenibacillus filicis]
MRVRRIKKNRPHWVAGLSIFALAGMAFANFLISGSALPLPVRQPVVNAKEAAPSGQQGPGTPTPDSPEPIPAADQHPSLPPAPSPAPAPQPVPPAAQPLVKEARLAALTFDDGPDAKYTPKVLDILKQYDVKATFFVVGVQLSKYPEVLRRMHEEGHAIGNHSWDHKDLSKLPAPAINKELKDTDDLIARTIGASSPLVRAPYGAVSDTLKADLSQAGRPLIGWTVDPRDWAGSSPLSIVDNVKSHIKPGGIILLHSFGGKQGKLDNTIEALPGIIAFLKDEGYCLVTVPELLQAEH